MKRIAAVLLLFAIFCLLVINGLIWGSVLFANRQQARATSTPRSILPAQRSATPSATTTATARPARTATRTPSQPPVTQTTRQAIATPTRGQSLPAPTPVRAPATPTPVRAPATPPPALLTSLDQVLQAVDAGQHGARFRLLFTEDEIQREVSGYLSSGGDITFSDIRVALQAGVAVITGKARVLAFNVGFTARTTVVVNNGRVRLKVVKLDLLGGLVPGMIKDRLIAMIEESADLPLLADLPVKIERVDIEWGQAIATGVLT